MASGLLLPVRRSFATDAPVLGVVMDASSEASAHGALFGMEEARHTAKLLRRPLELAPFRLGPWSPGDLVAEARRQDVLALISALPDSRQAELEDAASAAGLMVLDARAARDGSRVVPGVYRTGAPTAAYSRALQEHLGGAPAEGWTAALWTPSLFRYGAEQLNARYRRRFGEGMTGDAWAAWFAVKALSEAALRAVEPTDLAERLAGRRAAFDGHKGAPLSFDRESGQLIQPLYVIGPEETEQVEWPLAEVEG